MELMVGVRFGLIEGYDVYGRPHSARVVGGTFAARGGGNVPRAQPVSIGSAAHGKNLWGAQEAHHPWMICRQISKAISTRKTKAKNIPHVTAKVSRPRGVRRGVRTIQKKRRACKNAETQSAGTLFMPV